MASLGNKRRLFANPGRPGNEWGGRGIRFTATSYGPPWGGIEGTGVTARGTRLQSGTVPKMTGPYIIAVDPSVIPLGSEVYVWPNPFDYRGKFLADDTGGAIRGSRIDIYNPLGRASQNAWGVRTVSVSKEVPPNARGVWRGFDQDAQHGDLGPGGPVNFGGLDTGVDPTGGVLSAVGAFLSKLMSGSFWLQALKVLLGLALVIIGLARASGVL